MGNPIFAGTAPLDPFDPRNTSPQRGTEAQFTFGGGHPLFSEGPLFGPFGLIGVVNSAQHKPPPASSRFAMSMGAGAFGLGHNLFVVDYTTWARPGNFNDAISGDLFDYMPLPVANSHQTTGPNPSIWAPTGGGIDPWWANFIRSKPFCLQSLIDQGDWVEGGSRYTGSEQLRLNSTVNNVTNLSASDQRLIAEAFYRVWSGCDAPVTRNRGHYLYSLDYNAWVPTPGLFWQGPNPVQWIGFTDNAFDYGYPIKIAQQIVMHNADILFWVARMADLDLAEQLQTVWGRNARLGSDGFTWILNFEGTTGSAEAWGNGSGVIRWLGINASGGSPYQNQWASGVFDDPHSAAFLSAVFYWAGVLVHESVHLCTESVEYRDTNLIAQVGSKACKAGVGDWSGCCALSYMIQNGFRWAMVKRFPQLLDAKVMNGSQLSPTVGFACGLFNDNDPGLGIPGRCTPSFVNGP